MNFLTLLQWHFSSSPKQRLFLLCCFCLPHLHLSRSCFSNLEIPATETQAKVWAGGGGCQVSKLQLGKENVFTSCDFILCSFNPESESTILRKTINILLCFTVCYSLLGLVSQILSSGKDTNPLKPVHMLTLDISDKIAQCSGKFHN